MANHRSWSAWLARKRVLLLVVMALLFAIEGWARSAVDRGVDALLALQQPDGWGRTTDRWGTAFTLDLLAERAADVTAGRAAFESRGASTTEHIALELIGAHNAGRVADLLALQATDGSWEDDPRITALAVLGLIRAGVSLDGNPALTYLSAQLASSSSVETRALTMYALGDAGGLAADNPAIDALVAEQRPDGSWSGDMQVTALALLALAPTAAIDAVEIDALARLALTGSTAGWGRRPGEPPTTLTTALVGLAAHRLEPLSELETLAVGALNGKRDSAEIWSSRASSLATTSDVVIALDSAGRAEAPRQVAAAWLAQQPARTTEELARSIDALARSGLSTASRRAELITRQLADGGFGAVIGSQGDPYTTAVALLALLRSGPADSDAALAASSLVASQEVDGGWHVTDPGVRLLASARTVEALSAWASATGANADAVVAGLDFLATLHQSDGGFADEAPTSDTLGTAAAFYMLAAHGRSSDAAGTIALLYGREVPGGGWGDAVTTAEVVRALALVEDGPNIAILTGDVGATPATVFDGELTEISAILRNLGGVGLTDVRVELFDGATPLSVGTFALIPAHGSVTASFQYRATLGRGPRVILARATPLGGVVELDVSDNEASFILPVVLPAPSSAFALADTGQLELHWQAIPQTDIAGYVVRRDGQSTPISGPNPIPDHELVDSGLVDGQSYDYEIRAVDLDSTEGAAVSLAATPGAPPAGLDLTTFAAEAQLTPTPALEQQNLVIGLRIRTIAADEHTAADGAFLVRGYRGAVDSDALLNEIEITELGRFSDIEIVWPAIPGGDHQLIVVIDPLDDVAELGDDSNNEVAIPISVTGSPDLAVVSMTLDPGHPQPNATFTANATFTNLGAAASPAFAFEWQLGDPSATDPIVLGVGHVDGLASGEVFSADVELALPAGTERLSVVLDTEDDVSELFVLNNILTRIVTVGDTAGTDFVLSDDRVSIVPLDAGEGTDITISVALDNAGPASASTELTFYDGNPDTGGVAFATVPVDAVGLETTSVVTTYTLLASTSAIYVVADAADAILEIDEDNNAGRGSVRTAPDLYVLAAEVTLSNGYPQVGEVVVISFKVHNLSAVDAQNFVVELWDGEPIGGGSQIASHPIVLLAANDEVQLETNWIATGGLHRLVFLVDPQDTQLDADRTNNRAARTIMTIAGNAADLVVTSTTPSVVVDPQSLEMTGNVDVSVTNHGAAVDLELLIALFEDRDGDGLWNPGSEILLGSTPLSGGIDSGMTRQVTVTAAGLLQFRDSPVFAAVDATQLILESDESNNTRRIDEACGGVASNNLVINGGAELGTVSWVDLEGGLAFEENGWWNLYAAEGTRFFWGGLYQKTRAEQIVDLASEIPLIDTGRLLVDAGGFFRSFAQCDIRYPENPCDESRIQIEFIDSDGFIVDTFDTGYVDSVGFWTPWSHTQLAPIGTRRLRYEIESYRHHGTDNDGYHDGIYCRVSAQLTNLSASLLRVRQPDDDAVARLQVRIGNGGTAPVPGGSTVTLYDGDPNAGGNVVGVASVPPNLAPGTYVDLTVDWSSPTEGSHAIYAVAQAAASVDECRDDDNDVSGTFHIGPGATSIIDLAVLAQDITVAPPTRAGSLIEVSVGVRNYSNDALDTELELWDGPPATGTLIGSQPLSSIPAHGISAALFTWDTLTVGGLRTLFARVDPNDLVDESSDANNVAAHPVDLTTPVLPDLCLTDVDVTADPLEAATGDEVQITAVVTNRGAGAGMVVTRLFLGQPESGGLLLAEQTHIPILAHGQLWTLQATLSTVGLSGAYEIVVVVDQENAITELYEDNNRGQQPITVTGTGLELAIATDQSSYPHSTEVLVDVDVTNTLSTPAVPVARVLTLSPSGVVLDVLYDAPVSVGGLTTHHLDLDWNSGAHPPGEYRAIAQLLLADVVVSSTETTFMIEPDLAATSQIAADRAAYDPHQQVTLTSHIDNTSVNSELTSLTAVVRITDATANELGYFERQIPLLDRDLSLDWDDLWNTVASPPGTYSVSLVVQDAATQTVTAADTTFILRSSADTGAGLAGSVIAVPHEVTSGPTVTLDVSVENRGNVDLTDVDVNVVVLDTTVDPAVIVGQHSATATELLVAPPDTPPTPFTVAFEQPIHGLRAQNYMVVLTARVSGSPTDSTLDSDSFMVIDAAPPTCSIQTPASEDWAQDTLPILLSAVDDLTGVERAEYAFDGGGTWQTLDAIGDDFGGTVDISTLVEGDHELQVRVTDFAGNGADDEAADANPCTQSFRVDRTPPTVTMTIDGAPAQCSGTYFGPITVAISIDDSNPDPATHVVELDGVPITDWSGGVALTTSGDYVLVVTATDQAGNTTVETCDLRIQLITVETAVDPALARVLVFDDSGTSPTFIHQTLTDAGLYVGVATTVDDLREKHRSGAFDVTIIHRATDSGSTVFPELANQVYKEEGLIVVKRNTAAAPELQSALGVEFASQQSQPSSLIEGNPSPLTSDEEFGALMDTIGLVRCGCETSGTGLVDGCVGIEPTAAQCERNFAQLIARHDFPAPPPVFPCQGLAEATYRLYVFNPTSATITASDDLGLVDTETVDLASTTPVDASPGLRANLSIESLDASGVTFRIASPDLYRIESRYKVEVTVEAALGTTVHSASLPAHCETTTGPVTGAFVVTGFETMNVWGLDAPHPDVWVLALHRYGLGQALTSGFAFEETATPRIVQLLLETVERVRTERSCPRLAEEVVAVAITAHNDSAFPADVRLTTTPPAGAVVFDVVDPVVSQVPLVHEPDPIAPWGERVLHYLLRLPPTTGVHAGSTQLQASADGTTYVDVADASFTCEVELDRTQQADVVVALIDELSSSASLQDLTTLDLARERIVFARDTPPLFTRTEVDLLLTTRLLPAETNLRSLWSVNPAAARIELGHLIRLWQIYWHEATP